MRGLFARPARRTDSSDVRLILVIGALVLVFVQHGTLRWKRFTVLDETVQSRAGRAPTGGFDVRQCGQCKFRALRSIDDVSVSAVDA